ncbi:MAG: hypothetical protein AB1714_21355 [Acidobacteriota bacterium]
MVALELKRLLQEGAVLLLVLASITAGIVFTRYDDYLAPALEIFLLLYASFCGWSLLDRERRDGALEFMLALPASRVRLLGLKVLPRILCLALVYCLYAVLYSLLEPPSLLPLSSLALLILAFFVASLSLSVSFRSFFAALCVTVFLSGGFTALMKWLDPMLDYGRLMERSSLPLFVLGPLFVFAFRRLDVRPLSHFNRTFLPLAGVLAALSAFALYAAHPYRWRCHFILDDGAIVRITCDTCRATEWISGAEERRYAGCIHPLRQHAGITYVSVRRNGLGGMEESLARLDFATGAMRELYALPTGWELFSGRPLEAGAVCGPAFYLLAAQKASNEYLVLQVGPDQVRPLRITLPAGTTGHPYLFHAVHDPLRFVVEIAGSIWIAAPGAEPLRLGAADSWAAHGSRLLLCTQEALRLYDLTAEPVTVLEIGGRARRLGVTWSPAVQRRVLVCVDESISVLDLQTGAMEAAVGPLKPLCVFDMGDAMRLIDAPRPGEMIVRRLAGGRITEEHTFRWNPELRVFRIYERGIIVFDDSRYEVYRFNR